MFSSKNLHYLIIKNMTEYGIKQHFSVRYFILILNFKTLENQTERSIFRLYRL